MVNCARRIPDRRCSVHRASRQDLVGRRRGVRTSKGRQGPWCGRSRTPVGGRMATAVHESPDSPPAGCVVQAPPSSASPTTGSLYRVHTDMQSRSPSSPGDSPRYCPSVRRSKAYPGPYVSGRQRSREGSVKGRGATPGQQSAPGHKRDFRARGQASPSARRVCPPMMHAASRSRPSGPRAACGPRNHWRVPPGSAD